MDRSLRASPVGRLAILSARGPARDLVLRGLRDRARLPDVLEALGRLARPGLQLHAVLEPDPVQPRLRRDLPHARIAHRHRPVRVLQPPGRRDGRVARNPLGAIRAIPGQAVGAAGRRRPGPQRPARPRSARLRGRRHRPQRDPDEPDAADAVRRPRRQPRAARLRRVDLQPRGARRRTVHVLHVRLSEAHRWRRTSRSSRASPSEDACGVEASASAKREIISDFYLAISLFDSFDSRDPTTLQPKNDWGPTVSLGWQF